MINIPSLGANGNSALGTFSSTESALSPVRLEPVRGSFNIQKTGVGLGGFFDDLFGPGPIGEGRTTEQIETAPPKGITFNQQLIGSLIIGALVLGFIFLRR